MGRIGTRVPQESIRLRMNVLLRAASAAAATAWAVAAAAADAPDAAASAATPPARCAAPTDDRKANLACAVALARHAEGEAKAGRNAEALAEFARADRFSPDDLRFTMARAALQLKTANQLTPAGIEAATRAAPDDAGLAMMDAEIAVAKKAWATALADVDRVIAKRPAALLAWEMRATIDVAKPDFDTARVDIERALKLDPKSAEALRLRGIVRNNSGDVAGALADYQAAHLYQPRPTDPFVIGSTQFLLRQFGDAAASLATRTPPAPDGTYWRLWRYMALARLTGIERASGALGPGTPPGTPVSWPGPVIDFFHGTIDSTVLLDFAKKSQETHDLSQVCEAHFYMAEDALLRQRGDAVGLFRQAVQECPANFHEYEGATAELRAMGLPLAAPGPTKAAAAVASAPASAASAP